MRRIVPALVVSIFLGACANDAEELANMPPGSTMTFEGTDATLLVALADEPAERRTGLMGVEQLPADEGMAFLWPGPVESSFWMKDTLIPLSVAFVDEAGRVIDVLDMQPCESDSCPSYSVEEPFVLAVEANLGWFDDHGVDAGDRAELRSDLDG